jgi:hypothetical protein
MHQLPESGNFDIRHLESLRGFDIKRPSNKYGGEARSNFIKKGVLYTVSRFLPSLNQYRLYVRVGKHVCLIVILGLEWGILTAVPCPTVGILTTKF